MNTIEDIPETPGEKYGRVLWSQGLGYPLWLPEPQSGPTHFRDVGVMVGDVGFLCFHGDFRHHFNIFLPSDHPRNKNPVPKGFVPMGNFQPNIVTENLGSLSITSNGAHVHVSTQTFESGNGEVCYNIQSTLKYDAAVILSEGGVKEDLVNIDEVLSYVSKHAAEWYRFANGGGGEHIMNGSLHIVTGQHKAAVRVAASFHHYDEFRSPSGLTEFTIKVKTRQ